jgi:hypothetical protein
MIKVICTCDAAAHFDYARVEDDNINWILAKIKFFRDLGVAATLTIAKDDVRVLMLYISPDSIELDHRSTAFPTLTKNITHHVLREA